MKHYTDLFIDFDDTLYDTHGNAVISLRELFEAMHFERYFAQPEVFYDAYWRANIDLWTRYSRGEITRDYLIVERFRCPLMASETFRQESLTTDPSAQTSFLLRVSDLFLEFCSSKPGLVDGARELMDYLHSRGYRLHMCSNGFHEVQYKKLRACGLDSRFDTVILSEDAGYNKPLPQYFDYALRVSGASPQSTLMIGDNFDTDIAGALRAGLDAAWFNRFPDYPAPSPTTYVVTSLHELMDIL